MSSEKTEKPTGKRLNEARAKGQIAKTPELGIWAQMLAASVVLDRTAASTTDALDQSLLGIRTVAAEPSPANAMGVLSDALGAIVMTVLPLALAMCAVGIIATAAQTRMNIAKKAIKPDFKKLNPATGLKRMFKPAGLWQAAKSLIKIAIIAAVSWGPVWGLTHKVVSQGTREPLAVAGQVAAASMSLVRTVAAIGLVLAAIDYGIQKYQIDKSLRMSKQDIKEEHKQSEGNPEIKGQIRRRMQDMTRNRMLAAVKDASVVIVNPTHVAVALRYTPGSGAPMVVAKGRGHIALKIREEAEKHFVPVIRDIVLARTLERNCKVDQPIPLDLYESVAHVLAFVMRVGKRAAMLGGVLDNPRAAPVPPGFFDDDESDDDRQLLKSGAGRSI